MGQCPMTLSPAEVDDEVAIAAIKNKGRMSMGLFFDALTCNPNAVNIINSKLSERAATFGMEDEDSRDPCAQKSTFIVGHSYNSASLIPKERLEEVFQRESLMKEMRSDDEDRISDFTSITDKIRNTDRTKQDSTNATSNTNATNTRQTILKEYMTQVKGNAPNRPLSSRQPLARVQTSDHQQGRTCGAWFTNDESVPEENALHLMKKAHLAKFYHRRYLPLFGHNPYKTFENQTDSIPPLVSASQSKDSDMSPSAFLAENSDPIRLYSDGSSFLDLVMEGSLGLVSMNRYGSFGAFSAFGAPRRRSTGSSTHAHISPSTPSLQFNRHSLSSTRLYLIDQKRDKLVAMCCLNLKNGSPNVTVYSTIPKSEGQYPAAKLNYKGKRLYRWAEIMAEGEFPSPIRYSIYLTDYRDTMKSVPSYRASHVEAGNPSVQVVGQTEGEHYVSGCCIISILPDLGKPKKEGGNFSIVVARGLDPTLFICLAAFMDELLESMMRRAVAQRERDLNPQQ